MIKSIYINIFPIFIGGGIGAVLRYFTGVIISQNLKINLPISTFIVNIVGCFILGLLYTLFVEKTQIPTTLKFALTVGFCGGLTTFSTYSLELFEMISNSQILQAILYAILSIILGLLAVFVGSFCAKALLS